MPTDLNSIVAGETKNITLAENALGELQSGYVPTVPPTSGGTSAFSFSAPAGAITGEAITFATDGTLNFGTKKTAAVNIWEDFKGLPENGLLKDKDPLWVPYVGGGVNGCRVVSTSARYSGSRSGIQDGSDHWFASNYRLIPSTDRVHVSYWQRFINALGAEDYGIAKLMRVNTDASTGGNHYNGPGCHALSNFQPGAGGGGGYLAYTNSANAEQNLGYISYDFTKWNKIEYEFILNTPGVANGVLRLWVNNELKIEVTNAQQRLGGSGIEFDSVLLGLDAGGSITGDWGMLQSDTYVDHSGPAKFVLGNASTYGACTIFEDQPYTNWAGASSVTCALNRGAISGEAWAYFINDSRVASAGISVGEQ